MNLNILNLNLYSSHCGGIQEQDACLRDSVEMECLSWIPKEYCLDEVFLMVTWADSTTPVDRGSHSS